MIIKLFEILPIEGVSEKVQRVSVLHKIEHLENKNANMSFDRAKPPLTANQ